MNRDQTDLRFFSLDGAGVAPASERGGMYYSTLTSHSKFMQNRLPKYHHLHPDAELPACKPDHAFKAILIIDAEMPQTLQWDLSRWLVSNGCRCLLTWGKECASWAEAVDDANLERFDYADVPAEEVTVTTAHEDEELEEVFWFAKHRAKHPTLELADTVLIHIAENEKRIDIEALYADA